MATNGHAATAHADGGHSGVGHVVGVPLLLGVLCVLLLLTGVTYWVTFFDFGPLNLWVALLIAVIKVSLVVLYFMHLRYDRPFNAIILIASVLFVALFIGLALTDTGTYKPTIDKGEAPFFQKQVR